MQYALIVAMSIAASVTYGIIHDQITARICVEYFTIGHPPVFGTDDPTLLGLGWGVIATWWVGAILGVPLAAAARLGRRPPRSPRSLIRPLAILLAITGLCAVIAGAVGYLAARRGWAWLLEPLASRVPESQHAAFLTDLWAHSASYLVGAAGGVVLIVRVWRSRRLAVDTMA